MWLDLSEIPYPSISTAKATRWALQRAQKDPREAPYTTKVNNRETTSRGTTRVYPPNLRPRRPGGGVATQWDNVDNQITHHSDHDTNSGCTTHARARRHGLTWDSGLSPTVPLELVVGAAYAAAPVRRRRGQRSAPTPSVRRPARAP